MDAFIIFDEAHDGATNMAIDEALLEHAGATGNIYLRFYTWSEPTLSLGYFQSHGDRKLHDASMTCPLVRRSTGGGAIVHDHELTYSLSVPVKNRAGRQNRSLYTLVHEALVATLKSFDVSTRLADFVHPPRNACQPFLCFERRTVGDVLLNSHKICGSAQRRRHGAVLQHGSVLLKSSAHATELSGANDFAHIEINAAELAVKWSKRVMEELGIVPSEKPLPVSARARVDILVMHKHTSLNWIQRR
jgi:lipoate-protein ligase A